MISLFRRTRRISSRPSTRVFFYSEFSPYVGIAPDSLIDGSPAVDVAVFLGPNAGFYLSRFHFMQVQKGKISWNWAAALFPAGWLLYRKMYKIFVPVFLITLLFALPGILLACSAARQLFSDPAAIQSFWRGAAGFLSDAPPLLGLAFNISATLHFFFRLVMASMSNHLYRRHAMVSMAKIQSEALEASEYRRVLSQKGGVCRAAVFVYVLLLAAAAVTVYCLTAFFFPA